MLDMVTMKNSVPLLRSNPFDLQAVATYGQVARSVDHLEYVRAVLYEAENYLKSFPDVTKRFGGGIGLVGGHGSGKTHLLTRIGQHVSSFGTITASVLYAKADTTSMFEVLREFLSRLSREGLRAIIADAHLVAAREYVVRAKITESVALRLQKPGDLNRLYAEGNLERDTIQRIVEEKFASQLIGPGVNGQIEIPQTIVDMMLRVDDAALGDRAFSWLQGENVDNLAALGVAAPLRSPGVTPEAEAINDVAAINTIECLCALHQIAGRPLILLIDQLETLLGEDITRRSAVVSILKKFFEQARRQNSLVFVAGTDQAWEVRRDVFPRMRNRRPYRVGVLSRDEARIFLDAYTEGLQGFAADAVEVIRNLSGGNLREMIRIGYHAFERTNGELTRADERLLIECATTSGTVEDRRTLALEIADRVLSEFGDFEQDLEPVPGVYINRLALRDGRRTVAILMISPTDQLSEIDSARRIETAVAYLNAQYPDVQPLVISVGYSSTEVRSLLEEALPVVTFAEVGFAGILRSQLIPLFSDSHSLTADSGDIREILHAISSRLDRIEVAREAVVSSIGDRIEQESKVLSDAAVGARTARTRWELVEQLDALLEALMRGDLPREQQIMRSILIANEANLRLDHLEVLGSYYLELLDRYIFERERTLESEKERRAILLELRRYLTRSRALPDILSSTWRVARPIALTAAILTFMTMMSLRGIGASDLPMINTDYLFVYLILPSLGVGLTVYWIVPTYVRFLHWQRIRLLKLRIQKESAGKGSAPENRP